MKDTPAPRTPASPAGRYPELEGRVAVITGGARGIGRCIATRLAAERMRIVVGDIDGTTLDATAQTLHSSGADVLAVHGDLSDRGEIERLFQMTTERFGAIDLLVNNAADLRRLRLLDEDGEILDQQLATNVRGPYLCSQQAATIMRHRGGGSIVHISSVGAIRAHHRGFPYDVTKGAINAMTRAMAVDLGRYGIRVNAVGPGVTGSDSSESADGSERQTTEERIPLGRAGTPEDIAAVVAFLGSDDSGYVTGQVVYVDGGISAQLSPRGGDGLEASDRSDTHENEWKE